MNPVEYVFTGSGSQPVTLALSYWQTLDPETLRRGLAETLGSFPLAKSQLTRVSDTDYAFLPTDSGMTFDVGTSDLVFQRSRSAEHYVSPVRTREAQPLTRISLTQTPKGSVLAVSMSHALVDGFSYFHFLSSWARTCRGARLIPPSMDREAFRPSALPGGEEISAGEVLERCGLFYEGERASAPARSRDIERFFMSREEIASHVGSIKHSAGTLLSENDVITALLWKKYLTAWISAETNPDTFVTCPVDIRRIMPGVPRSYFGCALCFATASIDLAGLVDASIGELAGRVREAVNRVTGPYVSASMATLENLRRQKGLAAMEQVHLRHPRHGMIVTNLTRMPMRDIDFGSGAPSDYSAYAEVRGSAAILPAEGGIEVIAARPESASIPEA